MIEECAAVGFPAEDFVSLFIQLVLPVLVCGDHYQCEHIYEQVWTKLLGGYAVCGCVLVAHTHYLSHKKTNTGRGRGGRLDCGHPV